MLYPFDQRRASQILDSLGFTRASDGLRDAAGQRISLEIRTTANDDGQVKTMYTTSDFWRQIGLGVDLVAVPPQRESDREYRATRPAFEIVRQPGGWRNLQRFYGPNTPLPENNYTGINRTRHRNPEFDVQIDRFFATVPRPERMQILGQIVEYMTTQVLIMGMFWDPGPTMISNRLKGSQEPGATWDAHEWDLVR